jgi:hypothetical protein
MTKSNLSFAAALGFMAAGLMAAAPASAGPLNVLKPVVEPSQAGDLHLADGDWHDRSRFKHFRSDRFGGHDDHYFKSYKKKKYKRAFRNGYDEGYYDGRRDGGYYKRGYSRFDDHRGYRHRHGQRYGSGGYVRTPGFYFRF